MNTAEAKAFRSSAAWKRARRVVLAEEDFCGICKRPVDKTLPAKLPYSPEIDHIIPLERGGSPLDRSNHMLTHKICNQKKSNSIWTSTDYSKAQAQVNQERYRGPSEDWSDILGG